VRCIWLGVPDEVRAALDPHLDYAEPLAPRWLELMTVKFEESDGTNMLAISPDPEYRQARLHVYPVFLKQSQKDRRLAVLHEFVHVAYEPAARVFQSLLAATVDEDDAMHGWAMEEHRKAMEGCVTDLELGIGRLLQADPHKDGHA
jgi:hypothetical protein